jgi:alpha-tubulin suppressor-like RCC1 family protein
MIKVSQIFMLSSYVALACGGILTGTGCGTSGGDPVDPPVDPPVDSSQVSLEIRFQDDGGAATQQLSKNPLRFASAAAAGPTTHDQVARVLVDVTFADSGLPFFLNLDLTKFGPDLWRGDVPLLPRNQQLRFAARALSAGPPAAVAFSGETVATLTVDNQSVQIPLAPAQNGQTFAMPRMFRIVYPTDVVSGLEEQVAFTIEGNAGAAIGVKITRLGSQTPAVEFVPATGTVTLTNTVADFMTVYTPPDVMTDTQFDYQVTITDARAQSAVAVVTNFSTHVKPTPPPGQIVRHTRPSVLFNPVIRSLTANGSETPGTVQLVADVSDDSAPAQLTFQWSFAPNMSTPAATFANNGQGNPGFFQGYTVAHQGTITLAVTDENNGTTTLHYPLTPDQFADAIDNGSVNAVKRIVSGDNHNCVLTGQNRVRCWGDNQFGQLGYGNAIDVGDVPTRLPFTAGDVPLPFDPTTGLPFDPVQQLVAGNNHTCVLMESGLVYCWGRNNFGQLGLNSIENLGDGEPVTSLGYVTLGDQAIRIAAGGDHTCAVLTSGALRCWGRNNFGQLGRGNTQNIGDDETVFSANNVDLGTGVTVKDLALGGDHTCALLTTGAVRCWGRNNWGQLGYGDTNNRGDNEPISNLPNVSLTGTIRKLVAGDAHTCALTFAGTLRCWGRGQEGQLGQNFSGFRVSDNAWGDTATRLPSMLSSDIDTGAQVTDVTAGDFHTCALSSDGQLKCWGWGSSGQLGYGSTASLDTPRPDGVNLDGVTAFRISAGFGHTCALRSNGTARCWGANSQGQLGRGNTANSATATGDVDIKILAP